MSEWRCVLALDADCRIVSGSEGALADVVRRAADLGNYTEFIHNEHIDLKSKDAERVLEVAEVRGDLFAAKCVGGRCDEPAPAN